MKKLFILLAICFYNIICVAQIQVASTGNVCIGDSLTTDNKMLVSAIGEYTSGIYSYIKSSSSWGPAILGVAEFFSDRQVAIRGYAANPTPNFTGRSYGVMGVAGNRTSGYNYGVYGELRGENNGAGIYGTISSTVPQIEGKYAGFFYGNVYVATKLIAREIVTLSDARYKANIQQINSAALTKISALNPVQYTMASAASIAFANTEKSDTMSTTITMQSEDLEEINKIHYGLLAQEVRDIYPELVNEDDAGVMSINYIELIPLLIQAVQDLSEQVSVLSNTSNIATRKEASKSQKTEIEITTATLYQNVPNPFNKETFISYVVPTEAQNAIIYLYNMSGVQLNKYDINTMGEGSITISANELYAGTYLYSLVVDGRLIDTKQMIITE